FHQLDRDAEPAQSLVECPPLLMGDLALGAARAAHPRIDLVLDAVIIGRTHEDARDTHCRVPFDCLPHCRPYVATPFPIACSIMAAATVSAVMCFDSPGAD